MDGKIGTKTVGNVTSNGNIVIGAYYDTTRQESINKFSGLISGVNLYDYLLTPAQISQLYSQSMPSFYPALASASNSTSLNMTSMINPSIDQNQSSYLITQARSSSSSISQMATLQEWLITSGTAT
ncbi:hypothetical protein [Candidatus Nitrosotalea sp. TS]|uniref:hypothetical protein n=1 Tax=Candidatus Nitrosotalea sp. TS TaxID=2341020 RepID=UPI00140D314D|nr:hypothetical protein [Candidatus Nitrosotalea sp. TS]